MMRTSSYRNPETLREDDDFVLVREPQAGGLSLLRALADGPLRATNLARLEHEYALRDELDPSWAARPVALTQYCGRPALALDDPGGDLLARWVGRPPLGGAEHAARRHLLLCSRGDPMSEGQREEQG